MVLQILQAATQHHLNVIANRETEPALSQMLTDTKSSNNLKAVLTPNPARDRAVLSISGNINDVTITITDMFGRVLWQSLKQNKQQMQIPVQTFAQGMYFITVQDGMKKSVIRFLKE